MKATSASVLPVKDREPFEVDVKRFHLPYVITATCPHCGVAVRHDLSSNNYLMYPVVGKPFEVSMTHTPIGGGLWHEFEVVIRLDIGVHAVVQPHLIPAVESESP